ncbi:TorF family putative porin [Colwelliaceae bacterium MEBiC 14330]
MKKLITSLAVSSVLATSAFSFQASAVEGLSANVAMTSNYLWRGVTQNQNDAAISGGIDYAADSGFYVGTWVSNASWADGMSYELDFYGGFGADINDSMSYDVGFIYYAYPDETSGDADFSEVYGSFTFSNLTLGVSVLTSAEGADAGDSIYASADYSLTLGNEAEVAFHLGSYSGDFLADDYIDYGVSLSKDGFTIGASATDIDGADGDVKFYVAYSMDIDL